MKHTIQAFMFVTLISGCIFPIEEEEETALEQQSREIAEYNELQFQFDERRHQIFDSNPGVFYAAGNRLYWLHTSGMFVTLHSWDAETEEAVHYDFEFGDSAYYNFRASEEAIAHADDSSSDVVYSVYDATRENMEISRAVFPNPGGGINWWAYSVSGSTLYVVTSGEETSLFRVSPGSESEPEFVTTLESAGCNVEEFWDFGIFGGTMVFLESGRIWKLDLPSNTATWLENEQEVSGWIYFSPERAFFEAYDDLYVFEFETNELMNVEQEIRENDYQINETLAAAHIYSGGYTVYDDYLIYVGNHGLFAFHYRDDEVLPLLLDKRLSDDSEINIEYRGPVVLDNGTLIITGWESDNGRIGSDGPVYSLDLTDILL